MDCKNEDHKNGNVLATLPQGIFRKLTEFFFTYINLYHINLETTLKVPKYVNFERTSFSNI